jgi:hypothetical protein
MELTEEFYRGSYIDASCQVWLHLAKQFQRRRFFLTLANQMISTGRSNYPEILKKI